MKTIILIIVLFSSIYCYSQDLNQNAAENIFLDKIVKNINSYKAKTITIPLRLKYVDKIFEKIIFYDKKNHDIEFDISDRFLKKRIAPDMINIHEGMDYHVTFVVQNIGNLGQIIAELKGFKPVILDSVPEKGK
ncbi:MAG TPA: hypothetical protein PLM53_19265 [Spirochaetota bacterium]|nr:hypothetical protein [Spirochaetota bacterium]HPC40783.1 hypothetical protein [Spirochaetota bacterium]HQF10359.1 hypothetical protein [Spirochaetota bacterium]HQH99232.1 hypothetical protein [Spirochaetota bacterium]HQJ71029.1 hypothetical protein [Spirochaetota bacterium]